MESLVSLSTFFANKKVLVTGHTGFKGSWLCVYLKMLGAHVHGIALAPDKSENMFELLNIETEVCHSSAFENICHTGVLTKLVHKIQPEIVFHLAAQPLVAESYKNPLETFNTNVMGVVSILEAIKDCNAVKIFLNITTDKCYENKEWHYPYRESDQLGGHDPYSASKACSEIVTQSYKKSFLSHVAIATARAGNVIGGGDWADNRLLPDAIKAFSQGEFMEVRNPESIRPWQHVLEPLTGYLYLAKKLREDSNQQLSGAWNFGPKTMQHFSVGEVIQQAALCWGEKTNIVINKTPPILHEAGILMLDSSKAQAFLGFKAVLSTEQAISFSVDWYKAFYQKDDMKAYTQNQIEKYWALRELHG